MIRHAEREMRRASRILVRIFLGALAFIILAAVLVLLVASGPGANVVKGYAHAEPSPYAAGTVDYMEWTLDNLPDHGLAHWTWLTCDTAGYDSLSCTRAVDLLHGMA